MAIRIKARSGEGIEQMLRRFKKLCEKEGLTKEIKRRQYFEKPSERKRRAVRKNMARVTREAAGRGGPPMRRPVGRGGPGGGRGGPGGGSGGGGGGGRSGGGRPGGGRPGGR
jgi:small subunit ribosomal protein S21